jgi:outer membrane protein
MKKIVFILFLVYSVCGTLTAQESEVYDLNIHDAVTIALENNLSLKIEKTNYDEKKWARDTSWQVFIPDAGVSLEYNYYNIAQGSTDDSLVATLNLSLAFNAKMIFDIKQAFESYHNGEISFNLVKRNLTLNIKKAYYNLVFLYRNIIVIEEIMNFAKVRIKQADKLYENKLISELERLKVVYSYESLIPNLLDSKNRYTDAMASFKQIIGIKDNISVNLTDNFYLPENTDFNEQELIDSFIKNNLDIKLIESNIKLKEIEKKKNISILTPSIKLSYLLDPTCNNPFSQDGESWSNFTDSWSQVKGGFSLLISVDLDALLPWSEEHENIKAADLAMTRYRLSLQDKMEQTELEIKSLIKLLDQTLASINALRFNLDMTKKMYDLAALSFEKGTIDITDVYDAQQDFFDAKLKLLKGILDFNMYLLDVEAITS